MPPQSALLAELAVPGLGDAALVPDSPGPLSIIRSLCPDRRAEAAKCSPGGGGPRRRQRPSAVPFALPEAAGPGGAGEGRGRGPARRAAEWAMSALMALAALVLPFLLGLRATGGPVPMVL